MAGASRIVGYAVKYGVKYGPHLVVAAKTLKEPATAYAQKVVATQRARKLALAEAATLRAGSALKVFHQGEPVWVVYSGDDPVSSHPVVGVPLATLVERADLSQRISPEDAPGVKDRAVAAKDAAAVKARSIVKRDRHEAGD